MLSHALGSRPIYATSSAGSRHLGRASAVAACGAKERSRSPEPELWIRLHAEATAITPAQCRSRSALGLGSDDRSGTNRAVSRRRDGHLVRRPQPFRRSSQVRLKSPVQTSARRGCRSRMPGRPSCRSSSDSIVSTAAVRTAALPRKSRSVVRVDVSRDRDAVALPSGSRGSARNG